MDVEITRHGVPADEFEQLKNAYPLGKYYEHTGTHWYRLVIDMTREGETMQRVEVTWFKEWRV